MPKDDPARTGLTNSGQPIDSAVAAISPAAAPRSNLVLFGTAMPASAASLWARSLSMQRALGRTPQPITGTPASSNTPCTVPSSPFLPCRTGKAAANSSRRCEPSSQSSAQPPRSSERVQGTAFFCQRSAGSASAGPKYRSQRPSRVMPTGSGVYAGGKCASTAAADCSETPYSVEQPPKRTRIVLFAKDMMHTPRCLDWRGAVYKRKAPCLVLIAYQNRARDVCRPACGGLVILF